jgi:hypothetical protein
MKDYIISFAGSGFILASIACAFIHLMASCEQVPEIETHGKHYQIHQDFYSLNKVVELLPADADTGFVQKILGEPIDMGFDYRYLIDSIGEMGCAVGAVFHIDENGKIDDKWLDEICE